MSFKKVQSPAVTLYTSLSASGTSMIVTPYPKDLDGNKLTMAALGSTPQVTVDPRVLNSEEIIGFTGITDNGDGTATLTGLSRDLASSSLATPGTGKQHGSGAVVVLSWNPQDVARLMDLESDQTVTGVKTFSSSPVVPTPTNPTDAANKSFAEGLVIAGGTDASSSVKGVSKLTISPNKSLGNPTITIASPGVITLNSHGLIAGDTIQFTTTGALPTGISASTTYYVISSGLTSNSFQIAATLGGTAINTSGSQSGTHTLYKTTPVAVSELDSQFVEYYAETGAADAYVITPQPAITAYATGQKFSFKATNANTTTSTLNINGLGAKTIKKLGGGTNLAANDILAGMIVTVRYDGTNFQMLNPVGNAPQLVSNISTDATLGGASPSSTLYPSQGAVATSLIKSIVSTSLETSARFSDISNGGTNTFGAAGLSMDTTSTTTRNAGITWSILNGSGNTNGDIFANNPQFSANLCVTVIGTTGSSFFGIGALTVAGTGHTYTAKHAGFKIIISGGVATLYATQADGTTENVSSALTTLAVGDSLNLVVKVISGSSVNYYWSKNGGAWSAPTNLTSNMPTSLNTEKCQFSLSNNSTASSSVIQVSGASYSR